MGIFFAFMTLGLATPADVEAGSASASAESPGYRVIVHEMNPVRRLTRKELSRLFLKRSTEWSHGRFVRVVDNAADSVVRSRFSEDVHGKPVHLIQRYWHRQAISGNGVPPPAKGTDEEVMAYVRSHPGAIGYVSDDVSLVGCREVEIRD